MRDVNLWVDVSSFACIS